MQIIKGFIFGDSKEEKPWQPDGWVFTETDTGNTFLSVDGAWVESDIPEVGVKIIKHKKGKSLEAEDV